MSIFSLFSCNSKKTPPKVMEWPKFPTTDNPGIKVTAIPLEDGFTLISFFISSDKQNIFVLGSREPKGNNDQKRGEKRPGDPDYMDLRLLCLDTKGHALYHKDMLRTEFIYGGTFGLLEGELMLRVGDWFLVLEPATFDIKEKIPVHSSNYISWKNEVMTRDEYEADYRAKFDATLENCKTCKFLHWSPSGEYLIFVQGAVGKRSAWTPMSYEENELDDLKNRFEPIFAMLNPKVFKLDSSSNVEITDDVAVLREVEYLSGGTQFDYPNYKTRTVLQYELTIKDQKVHFSTTDRDRHYLRLGLSDNLMLSTVDGSIWIAYERVLYRIQ